MSSEKYNLRIGTIQKRFGVIHKHHALLKKLDDIFGASLVQNLIGSTLKDIHMWKNKYFQFMILKGYHNDHFGHLMIPSPSIDLVWGTHISDVLSYRQLCQLIKENFGTSLSDHIGGELFRRDCRLIQDYGDNFCTKQAFCFMWKEDLDNLNLRNI